MKDKKILSFIIIIITIVSIIFINSISKKGMLEEIVFSEISNTDFKIIDIGKKDMNNHSREQAYIKNPIDIDNITNMLSKLKLSEVRSIPVENSSEASYYIDLITETDEYVYLSFYQPTKYMRIGVDGKDYSMEKAFKIIDGNIDFILLDNLINLNKKYSVDN